MTSQRGRTIRTGRHHTIPVLVDLCALCVLCGLSSPQAAAGRVQRHDARRDRRRERFIASERDERRPAVDGDTAHVGRQPACRRPVEAGTHVLDEQDRGIERERPSQPDSGVARRVKIGDRLNGYKAEATFPSFPQAMRWLRDKALELYPTANSPRIIAAHTPIMCRGRPRRAPDPGPVSKPNT